MARRRRLADGEKDKNPAPAPAPAPPPAPAPKEKEETLQEKLARRRRLADGEQEMTIEDLQAQKKEATSRNSSLQGSASFEQAAHSSRGDNLQSIMERRRRLADGEIVSPAPAPASPPHSPSRATPGRTASLPISPMNKFKQTPVRDTSLAYKPQALTYTPQALSSPVRRIVPARANSAATPSATASPVKKELKNFSMSSDLKAIMDRRRKLASGEALEDEDPPETLAEETPSAEEPAEAEKKSEPATTQQTPRERDLADRASAHSKRIMDPSSHSVREKEPLIDVEDSDDDSSSDSSNGAKFQTKTETPAVPSEESNPMSLSSHHGIAEFSASEHKPAVQPNQSALLDEDPSDVGSDVDEFGTEEPQTEDDPSALNTSTKKEDPTEIKLFGENGDDSSSSEEEEPRQPTALDSPAAAVMGVETAGTEEVEDERDTGDDDEELAEVERFAASLEQDEPAAAAASAESEDEEEEEDNDDDDPARRSMALSTASEEADEVPELPVSDKKNLRRKLATRRKSEGSQNSEEASVDPSVTSNNSVESGGGSSAGGSARRQRGRRSSTTESPPKKSSGSGSNRRRSTTSTPSSSSDDRRKKPTKSSRRGSNVSRNRSDDIKSLSSEERPEGRSRARGSVSKDAAEADNSSQKEGKAKQIEELVEEPFRPSAEEKAATKGDEPVQAADDAFGAGAWGGFGAFNDASRADAAPLPLASEHSAFPSTLVEGGSGGFPVSSGGDAFAGASGGDAFAGSSDAFSSGDGFSGAFMADFGDATSFPAAIDAKEKVGFAGGLNDAFGAFDGGNAFAGSGPDAFDQVNFSTPAVKEEIVYDTSPLSGVPTITQPVPAVYQKTIMKGPFQGSIATNALNGNLIVCTESGDGLFLREVDPLRHYVQISAVSVVSPDLQRKVMSKFNLTPHTVESVIRLSAGLHSELGQTKLRVGAILDVQVLEAPQPLRLVVVWQWGQGGIHPVTIQYALSPPSGADFTYEASSLVMADNLIFLAGTSPKGPCVFVSKPAVRESWTANSLPGSGKVSAMEVTPNIERNQPYLAIALTDRSVSIWTYREAVEGLSTKGKESGPKRWLFPLCRLESTKTLSGIDATSFSPTGAPTGQGKLNLVP